MFDMFVCYDKFIINANLPVTLTAELFFAFLPADHLSKKLAEQKFIPVDILL